MINSVSFKGAVPTPQDVGAKTTTTPNFKGNESNSLERTPENDSFEKENHTVRNIAIGTVVALGLAAAADGIFNHGKYLKKIFGKAEAAAKESAEGASSKPKPEPKPEIDKPNTDYENWLKEQAEKKETITESNIKNEKWLEEQHSAKEKEYSEWWNKELEAKEAANKKPKPEKPQTPKPEPPKTPDVPNLDKKLEEILRPDGKPRFDDWEIAELTKLEQQFGYGKEIRSLADVRGKDGNPMFDVLNIAGLAELEQKGFGKEIRTLAKVIGKDGNPRFNTVDIIYLVKSEREGLGKEIHSLAKNNPLISGYDIAVKLQYK